MKIGFVGTARPTAAQLICVHNLFETLDIDSVHHDMSGALADELYMLCDNTKILWVGYPGLGSRQPDQLVGENIMSLPAPPMERYRAIVGAVDALVVLPRSDVENEDIYWYAARFAERMNREVIIIHRSGAVENRLTKQEKNDHD